MPAVLAIPAFWGAVGTGAAAAGSIYAANKMSNSADTAANLQSSAAKDALDYQKEQAARDQANFIATQKANYAQYVAQQARLAPYQAMGAAATARIGRGLGLSPQAMPALPPPPDYSMFSGTTSSKTPATTVQRFTPPTTQTAASVRMRAPNGDVSVVPAALRDHYLSMGAQVVN